MAILAFAAAIVRLLPLGASSMWLDEILETRMVQGSFGEALAALVEDAVHPPLQGMLSWTLVHLGWSEELRRLVPIALGVATVVLLARWTAARFGRATGLAAGIVAALSPVHVHYSLELRPYALTIFLVVLALDRLEDFLRQPGRGRATALWITCLGCLASSYFASLVAVPLLVLLAGEAWSADATRRRRARGLLSRVPLFAATLGLAMLPWVAAVAATLPRPIERGADSWTWALAGERWQFLSLGGVEGRPLAWAGIVALVVIAAGAARATSSVPGRATLAGALAGTFGVELLLLAADHWSSGRYELVAWPFLVVLLALGVTAPLAGAPRHPAAARALGAMLLAGLVAGSLWGIADVYRDGRPDWRRTARAVAALHRPGEPLLAANDWTAISLGHYLEGLPRLISLRDDPDAARAARRADRCTLVVSGGYPRDGLAEWLAEARPARVFAVGPARLHLVLPDRGAARCLDRHLPRELREPPPVFAWRPRPEPAETLLLDFDPATTAGALVDGWSHFSRRPGGTTFAWVVGRRATVALHLARPRALRLRLTLWPYAAHGHRQRLAVVLNGRHLRTFHLRPGRQTVELVVPRGAWRRGESFLELRFAHAAAPADSRRSGDRRRLAAAVDRLELVEIDPRGRGDRRGASGVRRSR